MSKQDAAFVAAVPEVYGGPQSLLLEQELDRLQAYLLAKALREARGNRTHAARLLGIPRPTLIYNVRRLGGTS